jgi:hypothetical protein
MQTVLSVAEGKTFMERALKFSVRKGTGKGTVNPFCNIELLRSQK